MICNDCGEGPATTPMVRVEAGIAVVERELCARCARSRGVLAEPLPAQPAPTPAPAPAQGHSGHSGVPWLLPPPAVGPAPPPAPRLWVRQLDERYDEVESGGGEAARKAAGWEPLDR